MQKELPSIAEAFSSPTAMAEWGRAVKATRKNRAPSRGLKGNAASAYSKKFKPSLRGLRASRREPAEGNVVMGSAPPGKSAANRERNMRMKETRARATLKRAQTALASAEKGEEVAREKVHRARTAVAEAKRKLEGISANPIRASILGEPRRFGQMASAGPIPQWLGGPGLAAAAAAAAEEGRPRENNEASPFGAQGLLAALEEGNDDSDDSDDDELGGGARRRKTKKTKRKHSRRRR